MKLTPTIRLTLLALTTGDPMTIGQLCEFTGATPYYMQTLATRMVKSGLLLLDRTDGTSRYRSATAAAPPPATPSSSDSLTSN
jgi:hypothetical protein